MLTAEKCVYDEPLDLEMPELDGVKVVEVPYRLSLKGHTTTAKKTFKKTVLEFVKKHFGFIRKFLGLNLDIRDAWAKKATKVALGLRATEGFDVVVSSYGPRACHFIGCAVKESDSSVFWVADYRDMWSIRHNSGLQGSRERKEQKLERRVLKDSNLVITVSEPLVVQLNEFLNKDVRLVFNGYDVDFSVVKNRLAQAGEAGYEKAVLKVVYTGMIYPGWQDPSPLFEAVNQLVNEGRISASQICIDFFGERQAGLQEIVSRFNAGGYTRIHGHVTRQKALEAQADADLLLLLESGDEAAKGVLTGKVFEYMVSGKPVLSLGSKQDSAIGQLVNETGIGIVCEQDTQRIKKSLLDLLSGYTLEGFSPKLDKIKAYSREFQSRELLAMIERQVSR